MLAVVLPLNHKYVYGAVPLTGLAVAPPLAPPLQLTFGLAFGLAVNAPG